MPLFEPLFRRTPFNVRVEFLSSIYPPFTLTLFSLSVHRHPSPPSINRLLSVPCVLANPPPKQLFRIIRPFPDQD